MTVTNTSYQRLKFPAFRQDAAETRGALALRTNRAIVDSDLPEVGRCQFATLNFLPRRPTNCNLSPRAAWARTFVRAFVCSENGVNFRFPGHFIGALSWRRSTRRKEIGDETCARRLKKLVGHFLFGRSFRVRKGRRARATRGGERRRERESSCRLILGESSFVERLLPPDETLLESNPRNAAVRVRERRKEILNTAAVV